ncbi:muramoyltetrapeptide carboxypeptidase [Lampropedia cohaerens]|uniref:Muramoyltetrapeptide carboxypeptidase n=1 Tax=Lampropedia cohaerens TaxID=1610491 RepID=A0A0U1Q083_9BURK|nr:LD-carboxypeptidase [Lampropedia cohaerens]KKW68169.1 muramoyltetrapeptide carboxypeptidase [Lampropedia cohaerens]
MTASDVAAEDASQKAPRIYVYSPSGAVQDKTAFHRGVRWLKKSGYHVTLDEAVLARATRFAGDHASRVAAVHRAADSGADLALISRGGYGINHLLPLLDYARIASAIDRGTQFMGFSDFTALQMALYARTGRITWAGASLGVDFGATPQPDEITLACFEDVLHGVGEGTGWRIRKDCAPYDGLEIAQATLWGGNLAVLTSLIGTPYFPAIKGGILFLEDVGEPPYRIERMLVQLEQAGVLAAQQAILLGHFTDARVIPHDRGFNLTKVVAALRQRVSVPVLTGLPFGHVSTKVCLPFGAEVSLRVGAREAMLIWGHL